MARRNPNLPRAGTPTDTNLFALAEAFVGVGADEVPNRFASVHLPHIRRCFLAGLIVEGATRKTVRLSARGVRVLKAYFANAARTSSPVGFLTDSERAALSDEIAGRLDVFAAAKAAGAKLREIARTRRPTEEETAEVNAAYAAAAAAAEAA